MMALLSSKQAVNVGGKSSNGFIIVDWA
jgi:hypothetical protein